VRDKHVAFLWVEKLILKNNEVVLEKIKVEEYLDSVINLNLWDESRAA
jgi:hypothetical protein